MSLDKIKQISIREYLDRIGVKSTRVNERRGMYHSPLREDKNASLSVDYIRNVWFDHGLVIGGSIIDLVAQMENCSIGEAISKLEKQIGDTQSDSFSFHRNDISDIKESNITIQKIVPLTHSSLFQYLSERCVNADIAKQHCYEIHYSINGRTYFAIGFKNDIGGYELRNEYFQGCTNKHITTCSDIDINKECCLVFEGFMDYLSYLTMKCYDKPKVNSVILNSVANLSKAMDFIKSHSKIYTYLDNDEAGKKATQIIKQSCPAVIDQSVKYADHKDLNDYLKSQRLETSKKAVKPIRPRLKM